jgi:hypothetical protein
MATNIIFHDGMPDRAFTLPEIAALDPGFLKVGG